MFASSSQEVCVLGRCDAVRGLSRAFTVDPLLGCRLPPTIIIPCPSASEARSCPTRWRTQLHGARSILYVSLRVMCHHGIPVSKCRAHRISTICCCTRAAKYTLKQFLPHLKCHSSFPLFSLFLGSSCWSLSLYSSIFSVCLRVSAPIVVFFLPLTSLFLYIL